MASEIKSTTKSLVSCVDFICVRFKEREKMVYTKLYMENALINIPFDISVIP